MLSGETDFQLATGAVRCYSPSFVQTILGLDNLVRDLRNHFSLLGESWCKSI